MISCSFQTELQICDTGRGLHAIVNNMNLDCIWISKDLPCAINDDAFVHFIEVKFLHYLNIWSWIFLPGSDFELSHQLTCMSEISPTYFIYGLWFCVVSSATFVLFLSLQFVLKNDEIWWYAKTRWTRSPFLMARAIFWSYDWALSFFISLFLFVICLWCLRG